MITGGETDGGLLAGKWFNPHTGQEIFVKTSIETENGMQIMTSIGALSGEEFSKFVKMDDTVDNNVEVTPQITPQNNNIVSSEVLAELENAKSVVSNMRQPVIQQSPVISSTADTVNGNESKMTHTDSILKKLFDKKGSNPTINIDLEWDDFPKTELETFMNVLDISLEDISAFIVEHYLDTYAIIGAVQNFLDKKLMK